MTYRNNRSYLRFEAASTFGRNPSEINTAMNLLIESSHLSDHLQDQPAVTRSQNAFDLSD
jgi:hypothetical protein